MFSAVEYVVCYRSPHQLYVTAPVVCYRSPHQLYVTAPLTSLMSFQIATDSVFPVYKDENLSWQGEEFIDWSLENQEFTVVY